MDFAINTQLDDLAARALNCARSAGVAVTDDLAQALAAPIPSAGATVAVVGEIKKGKSSIVNTLLRHPHASPVSSDVATSVALRFRHGPAATVVSFYQDEAGVAAPPLTILPSQVADFATEAGNPGNVKWVDLLDATLPAPLLARGLILLDTPGLGGLHRNHAAVTWRHLHSVDAVLFVTDSVEAVFSRHELEFLRRIAALGKFVAFVQAKCDLASRQQIEGFRDRNLAILAEALGRDPQQVPYFLTSTHLAQRALERPQLRQKYWSSSGFADLEQFLVGQLLPARGRAAQWNRVRQATLLARSAAAVARERHGQNDQQTVAALQQAHEAVRSRVEQVSERIERGFAKVHEAWLSGMATLQEQALTKLQADLAPGAVGPVWKTVSAELELLLAEPRTAVERAEQLLDRARELATERVVAAATSARSEALRQLAKAASELGDTAQAPAKVDTHEVRALPKDRVFDVRQLTDPEVSRLDHVLTSLGLAGTIATMVGAALPGVGWVAGGAVLVWMTHRRSHAAQQRQATVLRAQLIDLLQRELRSAAIAGQQAVASLLGQLGREGARLLRGIVEQQRLQAEADRAWLQRERERVVQGQEQSQRDLVATLATAAAIEATAKALAEQMQRRQVSSPEGLGASNDAAEPTQAGTVSEP